MAPPPRNMSRLRARRWPALVLAVLTSVPLYALPTLDTAAPLPVAPQEELAFDGVAIPTEEPALAPERVQSAPENDLAVVSELAKEHTTAPSSATADDAAASMAAVRLPTRSRGGLSLIPPRDAVSTPAQTPTEKKKSSKALPLALMAAGMAAMTFDSKFKHPSTTDERTLDPISEKINSLGSTPALLAAAGGLYFLDDKDTGKMALSALLTAGAITEATKRLTGRARPYVPGDGGNFTGSARSGDYKSFPSGHASATFALATVLANRHPKQKWLYYGLAAAVSIGRIRKSAHFPSDVLVGAGVGIYAGNRAVEHGPSFLSIKF